MDGTALERFVRQTRKFDPRRRSSRWALGFALAALVPGTAAFALPEEVLVAAPGFDTDLDGQETALPELPGMGSDSDFISPTPPEADSGEELGIGTASWYGPRFAGRPTASGERFNPSELTAAHRTLPFGSLVRVTSERTGKSIVVRINDRGPFHGNRVIDLSEAAAEAIGLKRAGKGRVSLTLLSD